jgi:N-acetylglucosamine kinase-like BadF-type ATPase
LADRLLKELGVGRPADLVPVVYGGKWDRSSLATLAPLVLETAASGDARAAALVEDAARALARLVTVVAEKLHLDRSALPLAMSGGLLAGSDHYRLAVLRSLDAVGVRAEPIALVPEPAAGAVSLALASGAKRQAGGGATD